MGTRAGGWARWTGGWADWWGLAGRARGGCAAAAAGIWEASFCACAGRRLVAEEAHQLHRVARVVLLDLGDEVVGLGPLRDWQSCTAGRLRKRDWLLHLDRGGTLRPPYHDLRRARAHRDRHGCLSSLELVHLGLEGEELLICHAERPALRSARGRASSPRHEKMQASGRSARADGRFSVGCLSAAKLEVRVTTPRLLDQVCGRRKPSMPDGTETLDQSDAGTVGQVKLTGQLVSPCFPVGRAPRPRPSRPEAAHEVPRLPRLRTAHPAGSRC